MSNNWDKFLLLMWKNWTLQIRKPIQTIIEILVPIIFSILLVVVRGLIDPTLHDAVVYKPYCPVLINSAILCDPNAASNDPNLKPPDFSKLHLMYAPNSSAAIDSVMDYFRPHFLDVRSFANSDEMDTYYSVWSSNVTAAGIIFDDKYANAKLPEELTDLKIQIRFPSELRVRGSEVDNWYTNMIFPLYQIAGPRSSDDNDGAGPYYNAEGFLTIQYYLTLALSLAKNNVALDGIENWLESTPYPYINMRRFAYTSWYTDILLTILTTMLPLIFVMSFVYSSLNTVKAIAEEKEKQLKESMKIMGLPNWLHWTAWFIKCFIFLAISCLIITILLTVKWSGDYAVLTYADPTLIYVFLLLYSCSIITLCFALSTFFSKANNAASLSGLVWFMSYAPYTFVSQQYDTLSLSTKLLVSLLQNSAMSFGFQVTLMYEGTEDGVGWGTLFTPNTVDDNLSLGLIMIMLIIDTFLYLGIALYVEAVFPGEFGVAKPWYFLFTKSFWTGKPAEDAYYEKYGLQNKDLFETEPTNLYAGVKINNLRKTFRGKVAVKGMSLNMYQDQITVLLGHNGAGKTTTMSMLTGMITPSGGTATISGQDIVTNIAGVRQSLGLCPQHNIIFDNLTVAEHLHFFGKLKGLKGNTLKAEIERYLKLLDFEQKKNERSSTLSGGMKRKLSVGIALCGNSKVVMLDEPTAGMDPSARRILWNLIEKEKSGRTILLTTHFMDEADLLGDRIAIMSGGELQCCGSSFFLKKKFGTGYQLIMEKTKDCDVFGVTKLLKRHIPDIEVNNNIGSELSYLLLEKYSSVFERMLSDLESESQRLGVRSYGISLTTLEEVFMKVGADHQQGTKDAGNGNYNDSIKLNIAETPKYTTGFDLIWNQFIAMFLKRMVSFKRSWFILLFQVFLPTIFLIIAVLSESPVTQTSLPALDLSLSKYRDPITLVESESNSIINDYTEAYKKLVKVEETSNMTERMFELTKSVPTTVRRRYIIGADLDVETPSNKPAITAYFNNEPYHSPGIALGFVMNAVFKTVSKCDDCNIEFVNRPLEYTPDSKITKATQFNQLAFNIGFSMAFVTSLYVMFIVREIVSKSKHLQFVSGLKVPIFWISHYVCDMAVFVVVVTIYIIALICFQKDGYNTVGDIGRLILILFYFACCVLPLIYLLGFLFEIPTSGYSKVTLISVFTGCVPFIVVLIFQQIENLKTAGDALHWLFLLSPWYSMISGVSETFNTHTYYKLCSPYFDMCPDNISREECLDGLGPSIKNLCLDVDDNYFKWKSPGIGRNVLFSFVEAAVLFALLIGIEYNIFTKINYYIKKSLFQKLPTNNVDEDSDVVEERNRIKNSSLAQLQSENIVVIQDLTKYYKNFLAVNGLSLGIKHYECFGLLGENGAGKTTTFKMMTGDEAITYGDGWVNNISIKSNQRDVQKIIGYCPQFDALLDDMTAKETIIMFALIRGVQYTDSRYMAENLASEFDFGAHLNKKVKEMSGGNKRKLSTALTLIGDPPVLYLDEPTTGMDPATKRYLWGALCRLRDSGKSIVLTSHSMEECEALCTRLAIMVRGNFKCLGSTQHLKSKFAQGYSLSIKIKKRPDSSGHQHADTTNVERFVTERFPSAVMKEKHDELLTYQITDSSLPWSRMFGILENGKRTHPEIEDYSLGQCTLEQVFLTFTHKTE